MAIIAWFPKGWFGTIFDNETEHVSTKPDPCKLRLAVDQDQVESNLGGVSYNIRRRDGNHNEMAYEMGRLTADKKAGAFYIATKGPNDDQPKERMYIDDNQAIFRVPITAPNLGGNSVGAILRAPGGQTELHMQGDGNLVVYDVRALQWVALWSTNSGKIREFREDGRYVNV